MRNSKVKMQATHRSIVKNAYRLLAENGLQGVSVARTMHSVGFTQGGFYRYFKNKAELVTLACQEGFTQEVQRWRDLAKENATDAVSNVFCRYVSEEHRDKAGDGCPLTSLTNDAFRGDAALAAALVDGLQKYIEFFSTLSTEHGPDIASASPLVMIAQMVGAVTVSRAIKENDLELSKQILQEVRDEWSKRCRTSGTPDAQQFGGNARPQEERIND